MVFGTILTAILIAVTNLTITEPIDGQTYDGDWLPLRVIVENENEVPDSVHYSLNGASVVQISRLNTDWPTYMQNYQNHGYSESPAPHESTVLWTAPVTGWSHEFPTPVVAEGIVYHPEDNYGLGKYLYALDAATGEIIWQYETGYTDDAVTVHEGCVYSASDSIFCLDAISGELIWRSSIGNYRGGTPIVHNNRLFCATCSSGMPYIAVISCLDSETGSCIWSDTLPGLTASCMGLWEGILFIPNATTGIYAIDTDSGVLIWNNTESTYWDSSPTIVEGIIYINNGHEKTFAFDALSGQKVWEQNTGGGTATIAYHDDRLYFASEEYPYYCLNSSDGTTLWTAQYRQHGSSAIADGMVFFGESADYPAYTAKIYSLNADTGTEVWSYEAACCPIGFQSSPSVTDGVMYYAGSYGDLYAFGTGLKYTYRDDFFCADVGSNELIVTSWDDGIAVAADTINFTVTHTGITLEPFGRMRLSAEPNPFCRSTSISFELAESGPVTLQVFDLSGRLISDLGVPHAEKGLNSIHWNGYGDDGQLLSPGLYFCRIESGRVVETTGLCLLK